MNATPDPDAAVSISEDGPSGREALPGHTPPGRIPPEDPPPMIPEPPEEQPSSSDHDPV